MTKRAIVVQGLRVVTADGRCLVDDGCLDLAAGEVRQSIAFTSSAAANASASTATGAALNVEIARNHASQENECPAIATVAPG